MYQAGMHIKHTHTKKHTGTCTLEVALEIIWKLFKEGGEKRGAKTTGTLRSLRKISLSARRILTDATLASCSCSLLALVFSQ